MPPCFASLCNGALTLSRRREVVVTVAVYNPGVTFRPRNQGALYGALMLASSFVIKTPAPGYKVPGLEAAPAAGAATEAATAAPVVQVWHHSAKS